MKKGRERQCQSELDKGLSWAYSKLRRGGSSIYLQLDLSDRGATRDWIFSWARDNILFDSNQTLQDECDADFIQTQMQKLSENEVLLVFAVNHETHLVNGMPMVAIVRQGEEGLFARMHIKLVFKQDISTIDIFIPPQDKL